MMGVTHVASGLLAGVASAPLVTAAPTGRVVWVLATAGAALLPDLDTPTSTAARMWGPISQAIAGLVGRVAGGHRWGTHDVVLAPAAVWLVAAVACQAPVAAAVLLAVTSGLVIAGLGSVGLGRVGAGGNLAAAGGVGWWHGHVLDPGQVRLIPWALALGTITHIAGDAVTVGKVPAPIVWLRRRRRVGVPVLRTGGLLEMVVVTPGLVLAAGWLAWTSGLDHAVAGHASLMLGMSRW